MSRQHGLFGGFFRCERFEGSFQFVDRSFAGLRCRRRGNQLDTQAVELVANRLGLAAQILLSGAFRFERALDIVKLTLERLVCETIPEDCACEQSRCKREPEGAASG